MDVHNVLEQFLLSEVPLNSNRNSTDRDEDLFQINIIDSLGPPSHFSLDSRENSVRRLPPTSFLLS